MSKYASAIIQLAIVLTGAVAQLTDRVTLVDALQLVPLAANVLLVYLVPLFGPNARSGWKTGIAIVGALAAATIPFATVGHITGSQVVIVLLAGLQALGAHIGVQIRNTLPGAPQLVSSSVAPATVVEPPTDTTVVRAIDLNAGEFLGDAAR